MKYYMIFIIQYKPSYTSEPYISRFFETKTSIEDNSEGGIRRLLLSASEGPTTVPKLVHVPRTTGPADHHDDRRPPSSETQPQLGVGQVPRTQRIRWRSFNSDGGVKRDDYQRGKRPILRNVLTLPRVIVRIRSW